MKTHIAKTVLGAAAVTLIASPCLAHTGGATGGFSSGLTHPIAGMDHLLAMVAVGVWSATQPLRNAWQGPALFIVMLAIGALLGVYGSALPFVEPGILASVVFLGLMVAVSRHLNAGLGLIAIGGFALFHGHAHGTEAVGALGGYMAGFMLTSAALHAAGFASGLVLAKSRYGLIASGLAIAAGGLALAGA
ncbi:MAG: HupE/UreJ family protein [Filomicrobium sp.]